MAEHISKHPATGDSCAARHNVATKRAALALHALRECHAFIHEASVTHARLCFASVVQSEVQKL